ncbi:FecR family protein [Niabella pedocola]|uniref:FecR family protein n=1 Tax=Niabella pedocola TaxID=1752077 RepID=A0ABS8PL30_9BACT|nr:FecR family protein [Niabella pedocola]MCD2421813.1 FecR family protein [Niabella pedocola]
MDKAAYYNELFQQFLAGTITAEQKDELRKYLASKAATKQLLSQLKNDADNWEALPHHITSEQGIRIREALIKEVRATRVIAFNKKRRFYYAAAAAIFILAFSSIFYVYRNDFSGSGSTRTVGRAAVDPIIPGSNRAILKLADGSVVSLTDSMAPEIALKAGFVVEKLPDGALVYRVHNDSGAFAKGAPAVNNTIQTPRGGQCRLILPDGSQVWLNSASSITFPQQFSGAERRIAVDGEAYFEVAHNKAMPFKVSTGPQTVEVLGTHFSISSSADHKVIKTALFEGSVRLSNGSDSKTLKPGQQAKLTAGGGGFAVTSLVSANAEPDWIGGYFSFENADFATMQEQLEKWYDVTFVYDSVPRTHFYGRMQRSADIADVLSMMEIVAKNIHFKIEGRKIYVIEK